MLDLMIRGLRLEAPGILGLELVAADGAPLPAFEAGAHLDLHLPGGLVRPYSLCNAPARRTATASPCCWTRHPGAAPASCTNSCGSASA